MLIDQEKRETQILAQFTPKRFSNHQNDMAGYHAVVWRGGKASDLALFKSFVSDRETLAALQKIGGVPGNNLSQKTWDDRKNRKSSAADARILGTRIEMLVTWEGLQKPLSLAEILNDPGGKGIDLRFGGNKEIIKNWQSGCIVCLYSCPGSKAGNHAYTVRDFVDKKTRFTVDFERVPKEKTDVVLIFRLVE